MKWIKKRLNNFFQDIMARNANMNKNWLGTIAKNGFLFLVRGVRRQ